MTGVGPGIQYAGTRAVENGRRGIRDHPLSRMITSVQDAAPAFNGVT
jgi:hypothetical protein